MGHGPGNVARERLDQFIRMGRLVDLYVRTATSMHGHVSLHAHCRGMRMHTHPQLLMYGGPRKSHGLQTGHPSVEKACAAPGCSCHATCAPSSS